MKQTPLPIIAGGSFVTPYRNAPCVKSSPTRDATSSSRYPGTTATRASLGSSLSNAPASVHLLEAVPAAAELRDRDGRVLAAAGLEPHAEPIALVGADGGDEVVRDELRRRERELRLDTPRREDRDRWELTLRKRTRRRGPRAAVDDEQHDEVRGGGECSRQRETPPAAVERGERQQLDERPRRADDEEGGQERDLRRVFRHGRRDQERAEEPEG